VPSLISVALVPILSEMLLVFSLLNIGIGL
jgi:hypothetical protein